MWINSLAGVLHVSWHHLAILVEQPSQLHPGTRKSSTPWDLSHFSLDAAQDMRPQFRGSTRFCNTDTSLNLVFSKLGQKWRLFKWQNMIRHDKTVQDSEQGRLQWPCLSPKTRIDQGRSKGVQLTTLRTLRTLRTLNPVHLNPNKHQWSISEASVKHQCWTAKELGVCQILLDVVPIGCPAHGNRRVKVTKCRAQKGLFKTLIGYMEGLADRLQYLLYNIVRYLSLVCLQDELENGTKKRCSE